MLCLARLLRRFDLQLDPERHTGPLDLHTSELGPVHTAHYPSFCHAVGYCAAVLAARCQGRARLQGKSAAQSLLRCKFEQACRS